MLYEVITLEDPVEFLHESKESLIVQREVGTDIFARPGISFISCSSGPILCTCRMA